MRAKQLRGSILLLITAMIWGIAFVAQSVGMDYVGPFTFTCSRSFVGSIVLLPCIGLLERLDGNKEKKEQSKKALITGGIVCGILLCSATCFQQVGIKYTSVGKAGFITAFYIILVPILGLFLKKKCGVNVWISVLIALSGLYFLCMPTTLTGQEGAIQKGDILEFICAFLFALHILAVDHFGEKVNGVKLSCLQFFVGGVMSGILMFAFETPSWEQIRAAYMPILYAGVLSSGVAYTLQIIGQKDLNPTVASLIMSLESVISVLAGLIILDQHLAIREIAGCILMFIAIVIAQLPQKD